MRSAAWLPGKVAAGRTNDNLLCLTDLFPTIASIVGVSVPRWAAEDGIDQKQQLLESGTAPTRRSMVTQSYTGILSIRRENWKLVFDTLGSGGFFKYSAEVEPMNTSFDRVRGRDSDELLDDLLP